MKLNELTIKQAAELLEKGEISSVELTNACLERIKKRQKEINAFITICEEKALAEAKASDARRKARESLGILDGIPCAVKDNIVTKDVKTTAASRILEDFIPPYDATVIKKLKNAGAVILGKTNMDEFAMGSSTENSYFGSTRNPCDLERVPGGSSGGSAAAVADHQCIYALGSDTGGSIRQPASFCGVVGLKPTYGLVSRFGLIAMASSLDQIGPITKTVEDAAIVLEVISGHDELDSTSLKISNINLKKSKIKNQKSKILSQSSKPLSQIRIGVPIEYFGEGLDKEVEKVIRDAINELGRQGAEVIDISLPHTKYALACYYIIMPSEVSSNLARYDGIKYGLSNIKNLSRAKSRDQKLVSSEVERAKIKNLMDVYLKSRTEGFGEEAKRRIMLGTYTLSAGYYDAYYLKAQKVRTKIKEDFDKAFEKVDIIVGPVSPTPAFKLGEKIEDPLKMYLSDIYTVPINLAGLPALSVPCDISDQRLANSDQRLATSEQRSANSEQENTNRRSPIADRQSQIANHKLPIGLQIIGPAMGEDKVLRVAYGYERV